MATYVRFLFAHPFYSLAAPAAEIGETFLHRLGWAANMDWSSPDEPLAPWLAGILRWAVLLGYGAAILSALALWRRQRFHEAPWLIVAQLTKPAHVGRWENLLRQVEDRPPVQTVSDWNIHAIANDPRDSVSGIGWTLVYTKTPCTERDFDALFSLHVWPQDAADLPPHRAAHGYENLDFSCTADRCWRSDERCVATAYVPDYPIGRMYTGQYRVVDGSIRPLWTGAEFTLQANTPRTE